MIQNPKFDEARNAVMALRRLIKPRSDELKRYTCADCAFHTKEHFKGEDEVDCFHTATLSDSPFTCLFHCKTIYNSTEEPCTEMRLKPMDAKFKEAEHRLSQNEKI